LRFILVRQKIFLLLILVGLLIFAAGCSSLFNDNGEISKPPVTATPTEPAQELTPEPSQTPPIDDKPGGDNPDYGILEIIVFDVGKADAILIITEKNVVMIDSGEEKHGGEIAEYLLYREITAIDFMIITHFDRDHVGGAAEIINTLDVSEVVVPNYRRDTRHYIRFAEAMLYNGIEPIILDRDNPLEFILDGVVFTTYPSDLEFINYVIETGVADEDEDEDYYDELDEDSDDELPNVNNFSLVTSITHGSNNFLFTGDAKARRIREILQTQSITETDYIFLKVPHHGRFNRRSEELINSIRPLFAVITCSSERPADPELVEALLAVGTEVFFTSNGSVRCISDGEALTVRYK
jgi:beta-lactamase superfamily II metal-dependent hydrolase